MTTTQVLIVGAGPTGLVLALRLARHGVRFRIVAKTSGPGQASRAMAIQARTLEFYAQLGFADEVVARGIRVDSAHFREAGKEIATIDWRDVGRDLSPYPFVLCFPQDDHERFLVDALKAAGAEVEWDTELTSFEQDGGSVRAVLRRGGVEETCEAQYLCGCDGAHTAVRPALGIGFGGGTYEQLFYVADAKIDAPLTGELFMHVGERSLALRLPCRSSGTHRLIGVVPSELSGREHVTFEDVRASAEGLLGVRVIETNWFSTYRVHHRVAERFGVGRVFIAGDAAHLHSPAGGQGMNTGIGDAVNLSWKLAAAVLGQADPAILDTYEAERLPFAKKLVETTDRAFQGMVGEGWTSAALRSWIVPHLLPALTSFAAVRHAMFATLSQTRITYRDSALSEGRAGSIHAGDRLPWTGDNYAALDGVSWRLQTFGETRADLKRTAATLGLPLDELRWSDAAERSGFHRDAAYLVRPDGHVGCALPHADVDTLIRYVARHRSSAASTVGSSANSLSEG